MSPSSYHRDRRRVALYLWRWEADELKRRAGDAGLSVVDYARRRLAFSDCACGHEAERHADEGNSPCAVCPCPAYSTYHG